MSDTMVIFTTGLLVLFVLMLITVGRLEDRLEALEERMTVLDGDER